MFTKLVSATPALPSSGEAHPPRGFWEGAESGMAADTQYLTPLTVLQNVPNESTAQTAPRTSVNPTHEQGEGRAPGWQSGWMKKNIPEAGKAAIAAHMQKHFYGFRAEVPLGYGHPPGRGPGQSVALHFVKHRPAVLPNQETSYFVASGAGPIAGWGEPA